MVTVITNMDDVNEVRCLSSDTKPTDVVNGSVLIEMDTSKMYFFDEDNSTWRAWS